VLRSGREGHCKRKCLNGEREKPIKRLQHNIQKKTFVVRKGDNRIGGVSGVVIEAKLNEAVD